jgi:hypothetical protein
LSGNKRKRHTKDRAARAKDLDQFLNIDEETQLLIVVKDIQDEISTIMLVLNDQLTVLKNFIAEAKSLSNNISFYRTFDETKCLESHQMIANNIRDFDKMASQAQKTYDAVSASDRPQSLNIHTCNLDRFGRFPMSFGFRVRSGLWVSVI